MPNEVTPTQADIAMADEIAEWDWHIGTVYTLRHYLASHRIAHEAPLLARNAELEAALGEMVYETTHLSPLRDDGSHIPRITRKTLAAARAALATKDTTSHD